MAIPKGAVANFETLKRAILNDDACIMEVMDKETGQLVDAICAVNFDGQSYQMAPLAVMVRENPYQRFIPPLDKH